eukprot:gene3689-biopygen20288
MQRVAVAEAGAGAGAAAASPATYPAVYRAPPGARGQTAIPPPGPAPRGSSAPAWRMWNPHHKVCRQRGPRATSPNRPLGGSARLGVERTPSGQCIVSGKCARCAAARLKKLGFRPTDLNQKLERKFGMPRESTCTIPVRYLCVSAGVPRRWGHGAAGATAGVCVYRSGPIIRKGVFPLSSRPLPLRFLHHIHGASATLTNKHSKCIFPEQHNKVVVVCERCSSAWQRPRKACDVPHPMHCSSGKPGSRSAAWQARQGKPISRKLGLASKPGKWGVPGKPGMAGPGKHVLSSMCWQVFFFCKARQGNARWARWQGKARQARKSIGRCGMPVQGPTSPPYIKPFRFRDGECSALGRHPFFGSQACPPFLGAFGADSCVCVALFVFWGIPCWRILPRNSSALHWPEGVRSTPSRADPPSGRFGEVARGPLCRHTL